MPGPLVQRPAVRTSRSAQPRDRAVVQHRNAPVLLIRRVRRTDLDPVIAIDKSATGIAKNAYWDSVYRRYGARNQDKRHFLVAELDLRVVGFVIGEVRDWEFGSPPCGWVFAIDVQPGARLGGIGTRLVKEISTLFRAAGVTKLRTMLARDNTLILSFFRSQGMMAGALVSLEMDLDAVPPGATR